jgi:uncharacterized protein (TIGR00730 family)
MTRLCIFCGSSTGNDPAYAAAARQLGTAMGQSGIGLVYGGGNIGLMAVVADAVRAAGGEAIGVIPRALVERELAHQGLDALHVVPSMHVRKATMADFADGFVALPGGIGTLEELFEIWTWAQLGDHRKPVALLNVAGFYDPLLGFLDSIVTAGFLRREHRALLLVETEPRALLARIAAHDPPAVVRRIGSAER